MAGSVVISVIVPIYNRVDSMSRCVSSILDQSSKENFCEVILIDDGSTDGSGELCDELARKHDNIKVIHQENRGVSAARNAGIDVATGKYLAFVDSDDYLKKDTLNKAVAFFDRNYDVVDLVAFPSRTFKNGKESSPHYRYRVLITSGVYDVSNTTYAYAHITRLEAVYKNRGAGKNIHFDENLGFQEDLKYNIETVLEKQAIGYSNHGCYCYEQQDGGIQSTTLYAYNIFETSMALWESEFAKYEGAVPVYLQSLYLCDIAWKLNANKLFPYHYEGEEFQKAIDRIDALLARVDSDILVDHPTMDSFRKAYFYARGHKGELIFATNGNTLSLNVNNSTLYSRTKVEIVVLKSMIRDGTFKIRGYLKSPCFSFCEKPKLRARIKSWDGSKEVYIPLGESSWSYYKCEEKTDRFWDFEFSIPTNKGYVVDFTVLLQGREIDTNYYFMFRAVFSNSKPDRHEYVKDNTVVRFSSNKFFITPLSDEAFRKAVTAIDDSLEKKRSKQWFMRKLVRRYRAQGKRVWLYHDCHGVEKNNAYFQFQHDWDKNDGIERYYVVNDDIATRKHLFTKNQLSHVIPFRGRKHKLLFLLAEKILTAYVEQANYMAFGQSMYRRYADLFNAEIVYLQHGVLHAHQPWKYSMDRLLIDKEVVSTSFEVSNLMNVYGFKKNELIASGMPRYDTMDLSATPERKILFAPSWRSYVVKQKKDGQWEPTVKAFKASEFYKEIEAFLNSERLNDLLERYDYTLDVKLHPILQELYGDMLESKFERIRSAAESVDETSYKVFITDYSSYRFDFVYLQRAIMYFFPDYMQFKSGMCTYRETDLPLDGTFGKCLLSADDAVTELGEILARDGEPEAVYADQMKDFFLHRDLHNCDRIYNAVLTGNPVPLALDKPFPDCEYVFLWGELQSRAGGMTRAMLDRACMLVREGCSVTVLLGALGKKQLGNVKYWAENAYPEITGIKFVAIEDYFGEKLSDGEGNLPVINEADYYSIDEYEGSVRVARTNYLPNTDKVYFEHFYSPSRFNYMSLKYCDAKGPDKDPSVILKRQSDGNEEALRNRSVLREKFYSGYVNDLSAKDVVVFHDPMLDTEPGFRYIDESDKNVYRIAISHGVGYGGERNWYSSINPRMTNNIEKLPVEVDGMVFLTEAAKRQAEKRLGKRTIFHVVPNVFTKSPRVSPGSRNTKRAVFIGRFSPEKQPAAIVRAFGRAEKRVPGIHLEMYGSGALRDETAELVKKLGYSHCISVMSYVDNPGEVYDNAALSIMASKCEGLPLALGESLSHGCPAISYDIKFGPSDFIKNGKNGFLVPANNEDALVDQIVFYFKNVKDLLPHFSWFAYESMSAFSYHSYRSKWIRCIESVIEDKMRFNRMTSMSFADEGSLRDMSTVTIRGTLSVEGAFPNGEIANESVYLRAYNADRTDYEIVSLDHSIVGGLNVAVFDKVKVPVTTRDLSICFECENSFKELALDL